MSDGGATYDAIVVGAGFAGLYAIHRLRELGLVVRGYEANDDVGGVWYSNRYPGVRCDVESHDYSFSFSPELEQEWVWSERFASQPEILRYIEHVAARFDLRSAIEFRVRVEKAAFDEVEGRWQVELADGRSATARFLVMASGALSVPLLPRIPGLDDFAGQLLMTSTWPHDAPVLAGKRIGVIGTGSSGVQVIPKLAGVAARLTVLQRTPAFSVPAQNRSLDAREVAEIKADYRRRRQLARESASGMTWQTDPRRTAEVPENDREAIYRRFWNEGLNLAHSFSDILTDRHANDLAADFVRARIEEIVIDPGVAERLTAMTYPIGAKRLCRDTNYFETFNEPHVELVDLGSEPIERFVDSGVVTSSRLIELDVLVLATGFDALTGAVMAMELRGRGSRTLAEEWSAGPESYLGLMVAGFPNLFLVTGPGSPSVLSNMVNSIEQHVEWIADLVAFMRERGSDVVETTPVAQADWSRHVDEVAQATLFPQASSWYMGSNLPGKSHRFLPYAGGVGAYRRRCDEERRDGYPGLVFGAVR